MRAIQITEFGEPQSVQEKEVPTPRPATGEVLVRIEAAGVNPSDAVNIKGGFKKTTLPRIIGRDFAGTVVEGPPSILGAKVWGSGGDLGFTRDGTHAEYVAVPEHDVSARPENLTAAQAGAIGIPFITAYLALIERGGLQSGQWALVSGAAGAVGNAALQIATWVGARVIALVKDATELARVDTTRVVAVAQSDRANVAKIVADTTNNRGVDVALNVVGAPLFDPLLASLTNRGRMAIISSVGGKDVSVDIFDLYRRQLSIIGVDSAQTTAKEGAAILDHLRNGFESGALLPPRIDAEVPLVDAAEAYVRAEKAAGEKLVIVP